MGGGGGGGGGEGEGVCDCSIFIFKLFHICNVCLVFLCLFYTQGEELYSRNKILCHRY